jgi:hypothetical protein
MRKILYALLLPVALLLPPALLRAQSFSFASPADSLAVRGLVDRYLALNPAEVLPTDTARVYAAEELAKRIADNGGHSIRFPVEYAYTVQGPRPVRADGSLAITTVSYVADSVPLFGPLTIDWVLFARRDSVDGRWRLTAARQLAGMSDQVEKLMALDKSDFPASLKKVIAWERSRMLLSNAQLREQLLANRAAYASLASQFRRGDSVLRTIARNDRVITQLNTLAIYWGAAAEAVPREAIDEYMSRLDKAQQKDFREQLRDVEKQRRNGYDTLARVAKRVGVKTARLDSVVGQMHDLGILFATSKLPWKGAVQLTVGGYFDDVCGYIYSPSGELPLVSPDEYFYLEDLGDGWWIFRST